MRLLPASVAILLLGLLAPVAHAGNGAFIPPMRVDVGPAMSHLEPTPGLQVVAGLHWASLAPRPKAGLDFGIGVISMIRGSDEEPAPMEARSAPGHAPLSMVGGYVEVATRTRGNGWWRTWVGSRIESGRASRDGDGQAFVGVATRISTEAYVTAAGGSGSGLILGVLAIGVYGELAARRFDGLGNDVGVSLGISMRVPLIAVD